MNLGQMTLAVGALSLLGLLILNTNGTLLSTDLVMNESEFGITAVSLATSLVEEAMGKSFDSVVSDTTNPLTDPSTFTPTGSLGHSASESYRASQPSTTDFNDFDDYNDLFLVYKSNVATDTVHTPGADYEQVVTGIHSKYYLKAKVRYVDPNNLQGYSVAQTRHKKLTVTVTRPKPNPTRQDTLIFSAVISFW
jgi:hypothetical protein